jgi:hypothetical protein
MDWLQPLRTSVFVLFRGQCCGVMIAGLFAKSLLTKGITTINTLGMLLAARPIEAGIWREFFNLW